MNSIPLTLVWCQLTWGLKSSTPFSLQALKWPGFVKVTQEQWFSGYVPWHSSPDQTTHNYQCTQLSEQLGLRPQPPADLFQCSGCQTTSISFYVDRDEEQPEEFSSMESKWLQRSASGPRGVRGGPQGPDSPSDRAASLLLCLLSVKGKNHRPRVPSLC